MPKQKPKLEGHMQPQIHAIIVLVSLVIFSMAASRASILTLAGWESSLFRGIYGLPGSWTNIFLAITHLGSVWMIFILGLATYAQKMRKLAAKLIINSTVAILAVEYFKHVVIRPRPVGLLPSITQRETFVTGYGFPSGHTAIATVLALTLLPYVPKPYRWVPWTAIVLVAFSRVYLGVHAPLDVIGGFALGLMIVSLQHTFTTTRHRIGPRKNQSRRHFKATAKKA